MAITLSVLGQFTCFVNFDINVGAKSLAQRRGLAGSSSAGAPWIRPQLEQEADDEREWSQETNKARLQSA
jgi:hypothetical protein